MTRSLTAPCTAAALGRAGLLLLACTTPFPVRAQAPAAVARETAFARRLVEQLGYLDLAEEHLERLRRSLPADPATTEELDVGRIEALLAAARIGIEGGGLPPLARAVAYADALFRHRPTAARAHELRRALVTTAVTCVRRWRDEERPTAAITAWADRLVAACDALQPALDAAAKAPGDRRAEAAAAQNRLYRAILLREMARAGSPAERREPLARAQAELEELVVRHGTESGLGATALLEYADALQLDGRGREAIQTAQETLHGVFAALMRKNAPPTGPSRELLTAVLERGYLTLAQLLIDEHRAAEIPVAAEELRSRLARIDARAAPRHADEMALFVALAHRQMGTETDVAKAFDLARQVAERHPSGALAQRSRRLLADLALHPGIDPAVAAQSAVDIATFMMRDGRSDEAAAFIDRALAATPRPDPAPARLLTLLGRCQLELGRPGPAHATFKRALDTLNTLDTRARDEETVQDALSGMWSAADRLRTANASDAARYAEEAAAYARQHGSGEIRDVAAWREAQRHFADGRYEEALAACRQVGPTAPAYEAALVRAGVCLLRLGRLAQARAALTDYLDRWIADPAHEIPEAEERRLTIRARARCEATLHLGLCHYEAARRQESASAPADPAAHWRAVTTVLATFHSVWPDATDEQKSAAWFVLVKAYAWLEDLEQARATFTRFAQRLPNDAKLASLALTLYLAHRPALRALERESAAGGGRDLERRLAAARQIALAFAREHLAREATPQLPFLREAAALARQGGDLSLAQRLLAAAVRIHGDGQQQTIVATQVIPDLAGLLLSRREFGQALELVDEALQAHPDQRALHEFRARALGGWIERAKDGTVVRVLGLERFEEAYRALWDDYRPQLDADDPEGFSLPWYQFHLLCAYYLTQAAQARPELKETARRCVRIAESIDGFHKLRSYGAAGEELLTLFKALEP